MKTSTTYLNLAVPEAEAPQVVLSEVTILALSATHFVTSMPIDRHPALSIHRSLVRLLFAVKCLEEVYRVLCALAVDETMIPLIVIFSRSGLVASVALRAAAVVLAAKSGVRCVVESTQCK